MTRGNTQEFRCGSGSTSQGYFETGSWGCRRSIYLSLSGWRNYDRSTSGSMINGKHASKSGSDFYREYKWWLSLKSKRLGKILNQ